MRGGGGAALIKFGFQSALGVRPLRPNGKLIQLFRVGRRKTALWHFAASCLGFFAVVTRRKITSVTRNDLSCLYGTYVLGSVMVQVTEVFNRKNQS